MGRALAIGTSGGLGRAAERATGRCEWLVDVAGRNEGDAGAVRRTGRPTGRALWTLFLTLFLAGCVTINIYFPAAAAEEAAREIVRDVLHLDALPGAPPGTSSGEALEGGEIRRSEERSAIEPQEPLVSWVVGDRPEAVRPPMATTGARAWQVLSALVTPAQAQTPNIRIETPATQRLRASMRSRDSELRPFYQAGAIGFGNDGSVAIRDLSAAPLRDRQTLQRLVAEENADRDALYRELARANDRPDWESQIRATFARVWIDEAPSGYYVQDRSGQWARK